MSICTKKLLSRQKCSDDIQLLKEKLSNTSLAPNKLGVILFK